MIRTVIVEDEPGARKVLESLLEEYVPQVTIVGVGEDVNSGIEVINTQKPELVFMDIRLPDGDSFEILEECKHKGFNVIFTTAYGDYREQAFDKSALHYLTKPIDIDKLIDAVGRYEARSKKSFDPEMLEVFKTEVGSNKKKLALPNNDGYVIVDVSDITYCEAQSNYTKINLNNGKSYVTSKSLKFYDQRLMNGDFYRIHKSFLVNINFIKEVKSDGYVVLFDGSCLSISQRAKSGFMKYLEG